MLDSSAARNANFLNCVSVTTVGHLMCDSSEPDSGWGPAAGLRKCFSVRHRSVGLSIALWTLATGCGWAMLECTHEPRERARRPLSHGLTGTR